MFRVGQRVVCVDDTFSEGILKWLIQIPKKGEVYTIREIQQGIDERLFPSISLLLKGINNGASDAPPYRERGFHSRRFRPLTEEENKTQTKNKKEKPCLVS